MLLWSLFPSWALCLTFIITSSRANYLGFPATQVPSSQNGDSSTAESILVLPRSLQYQHQNRNQEEAKTGSRKRGVALTEGLHLILRHQQSAIVPGISCAGTLKGFWQLLSMKALYNGALSEPTKELFTFTEGNLQATFSSLGTQISWAFVQQAAMDFVGQVGQ